jgi:deazaflavin-dependent oxidoreductase (nitroreductase family)
MSADSPRSGPPPGLRWFFRLPGALYRWRLGWALDHRFLQVTHRGRKSGRVYQTVLEVIWYDPRTRESIVVSGWGARADWYRNIRAGGALEVQVGRERYVPRCRLLPPEEAAAVATFFVAAHPREAPIALWVLRRLGWTAAPESAGPAATLATVPMVAFQPA